MELERQPDQCEKGGNDISERKNVAGKVAVSATEKLQEIRKELIALMDCLRKGDSDDAVAALDELHSQLRFSTSSMVSVSVVLKAMRSSFEDLKAIYASMPEKSVLRNRLADLLSVVAASFDDTDRLVLKYFLEGTRENVTSWGDEYLKSLASEIIAETYLEATSDKPSPDESDREMPEVKPPSASLVAVAFEIIEHYMKHRNELDAIDLLVELRQIDSLVKFVDSRNYQRIGQYVLSLADYMENYEKKRELYEIMYQIYMKEGKYCQALRVALKMRSHQSVLKVLTSCKDPIVRLQMCYLLSSSRYYIPEADLDALGPSEAESKILRNEHLSEMYLYLSKELDLEEPKTPEHIYKNSDEYLDADKPEVIVISSYVNAFVNAAHCNDCLMTSKNNSRPYKFSKYGVTGSVAALGLIYMWNIDRGLPQMDEFQWADKPLMKAGAYMGFGLVANCLKSEMDPAMSLVAEHVESCNLIERAGAILGLAFAYVGYPREELLEILGPIILDLNQTDQMSSFAALALGLSFMGTGNQAASEALIQTIAERPHEPEDYHHSITCLFPVALGLLYFNMRSEAEPTIELLQNTVQQSIGQLAVICVTAMAYAGSGDMKKVEHFMRMCVNEEPSSEGTVDDSKPAESANVDSAESNLPEEKDEKKQDRVYQSAVVLAVAAIVVGEEVGTEMVLRILEQLLHYGSRNIKRAVPFAFALLSAGNARPNIIDRVSKLFYELDTVAFRNASFALGVIGAGTNNARIADILRQTPSRLKEHLMSRFGQGLVYMGKGLMTLSCLHSDRFLIDPVTFCCLYSLCICLLFMKDRFFEISDVLLYLLAPAMRPRMLITVDENLKPLPVVVRVGKAVDTTGQAGQPKSITGFQTHTTPVLLAEGNRAELGTVDYVQVDDLPLEGIVILKPAIPQTKDEGGAAGNSQA